VIVLCVLLGFFVLIIGGCATCAYFVGKKAKEFKQTADKNPQFAAISMVLALNPDVQVVSKNETTGIITVRNKKTGEITKIDSNDYTADNVGKALEDMGRKTQSAASKMSAEANDAAQKAAASVPSSSTSAHPSESRSTSSNSAAMASTTKQLPSFVPTYPGSTTTDCSVSSMGGMTVGSYEFSTSDSIDTVGTFYEKKIKANNLQVVNKAAAGDDNGNTFTLIGQSEDGKTMSVIVNSEDGKTKGHITFGSKL